MKDLLWPLIQSHLYLCLLLPLCFDSMPHLFKDLFAFHSLTPSILLEAHQSLENFIKALGFKCTTTNVHPSLNSYNQQREGSVCEEQVAV